MSGVGLGATAWRPARRRRACFFVRQPIIGTQGVSTQAHSECGGALCSSGVLYDPTRTEKGNSKPKELDVWQDPQRCTARS